VGLVPFNNPALEVEVGGDVWLSEPRGMAFTGSLLYNFDISHPTLIPYAGGGISYLRFSGSIDTGSFGSFGYSGSDTDLQLGGGVRIKRGGRDLRVDIRFMNDATRLLIGMSF